MMGSSPSSTRSRVARDGRSESSSSRALSVPSWRTCVARARTVTRTRSTAVCSGPTPSRILPARRSRARSPGRCSVSSPAGVEIRDHPVRKARSDHRVWMAHRVRPAHLAHRDRRATPAMRDHLDRAGQPGRRAPPAIEEKQDQLARPGQRATMAPRVSRGSTVRKDRLAKPDRPASKGHPDLLAFQDRAAPTARRVSRACKGPRAALD